MLEVMDKASELGRYVKIVAEMFKGVLSNTAEADRDLQETYLCALRDAIEKLEALARDLGDTLEAVGNGGGRE